MFFARAASQLGRLQMPSRRAPLIRSRLGQLDWLPASSPAASDLIACPPGCHETGLKLPDRRTSMGSSSLPPLQFSSMQASCRSGSRPSPGDRRIRRS